MIAALQVNSVFRENVFSLNMHTVNHFKCQIEVCRKLKQRHLKWLVSFKSDSSFALFTPWSHCDERFFWKQTDQDEFKKFILKWDSIYKQIRYENKYFL